MRAPIVPARSPSGRPTCPSTGPLDAEILCLGESPADHELAAQEPFVGKAGRVFNLCLTPAGINRPEIRIVNPVPAQPPGNSFDNHDPRDILWGKRLLQQELQALPNLKIIVTMGANPTRWVTGLAPITKWRGSMIAPQSSLRGDHYNEYLSLLKRTPEVAVPDVAVMPTFHPAAVARQFPWHFWLINDLARARSYVDGTWQEPHYRTWYVNRPDLIDTFVDDTLIGRGKTGEHLVSIDTEMDPQVVALVSEDEVHVFTFDDRYHPALTRLMSSPWVLKVAHNMAHDWRQFHKVFGIPVSRPWFDSIAGAHILEPSGMDPGGDRDKSAGEQQVGKALSPHIATRYTPWPYHKVWLEAIDVHHYCGVDAIVPYDAYWNQLRALSEMPQGLALASHDMKLFEVLMAMQNRGLRIDEVARQIEEDNLHHVIRAEELVIREVSDKWVRLAYTKDTLRKPHLFKRTRTCPCCGNGKNKLHACWSCAGFSRAPSKKELQDHWDIHNYLRSHNPKASRADLAKYVLTTCQVCSGQGKTETWLPINYDSPDQVKDLLYRALGLPPRRFEGKETIRFAQLEPMLASTPSVARPTTPREDDARLVLTHYIERAKTSAELTTIERIAPEPGEERIHPSYDPWYTPTQRVASRESLHDAGTNAQNLPKKARRMVIPADGYAFNYPDYAQIEARCVAVRCKDQALMDIFRDPSRDVHVEVADLLEKEAGVVLSRDDAKHTLYAGMYGVEAAHLSQVLTELSGKVVSVGQARQALAALFSVFSGLARYQHEVREELLRSRSNTSPTGWCRRWLNYVTITRGKKRGQLVEKYVKEAMATTPQNMAAHVLALGLIETYERSSDWLHPVAHVHDAGLFEEPLDRLDEADALLEDAMTIEKWDMVFPAEPSHGPNWYVASLRDDEKRAEGYQKWTRDAVLGLPQ